MLSVVDEFGGGDAAAASVGCPSLRPLPCVSGLLIVAGELSNDLPLTLLLVREELRVLCSSAEPLLVREELRVLRSATETLLVREELRALCSSAEALRVALDESI